MLCLNQAITSFGCGFVVEQLTFKLKRWAVSELPSILNRLLTPFRDSYSLARVVGSSPDLDALTISIIVSYYILYLDWYSSILRM